ncbi:Nramp family divalent metal transporter [Pseudonocardia sp. NPDC046786]|uniref:Nramp family divalent metal transporter n=1 Tax=Pseudonocardia sp. NPDC046786 TaxID=3155471 RepID=UPI0033F4856B
MSDTTRPADPAPEGIIDDPYRLNPANIQEPPRGWKASLRFLGPGMITSAAIVGSGELITTTTLGAQVGFVLLWLVFVSTFVKVAVQIELARWSISTGKASIFGYDEVPPKIGRHSWVSYLTAIQFVPQLLTQSGLITASGLALALILPVNGEPGSMVSVVFWVAILVVGAIGIHVANRYEIVEKVSTALVVLVVVSVVSLVVVVQWTPFAWSAADIGGGLQFQIAMGAVGVAISMFGITGTGALEITGYSFWCLEKGYAAWTGPNDGSEEWARRASGWIAVMKKDAWVSWGVYTAATAAFYMLGAAVLHPQGLVPKGNDVLTTLSRIFTDSLGSWAGVAFMVLAVVTLYKTILSNIPSFSRMITACIAVFGVFDWALTGVRRRWVRALIIAQPILFGVVGVLTNSPLALVIFGGIANAFYLIAVAVATVYLTYTQTDPRIRAEKTGAAYLMISSLAIIAVGVFGLIAVF